MKLSIWQIEWNINQINKLHRATRISWGKFYVLLTGRDFLINNSTCQIMNKMIHLMDWTNQSIDSTNFHWGLRATRISSEKFPLTRCNIPINNSTCPIMNKIIYLTNRMISDGIESTVLDNLHFCMTWKEMNTNKSIYKQTGSKRLVQHCQSKAYQCEKLLSLIWLCALQHMAGQGPPSPYYNTGNFFRVTTHFSRSTKIPLTTSCSVFKLSNQFYFAHFFSYIYANIKQRKSKNNQMLGGVFTIWIFNYSASSNRLQFYQHGASRSLSLSRDWITIYTFLIKKTRCPDVLFKIKLNHGSCSHHVTTLNPSWVQLGFN